MQSLSCGWTRGSEKIIHLRCGTEVIVKLYRQFSGSTLTGRPWSTSSSAVRHMGRRRFESAMGRVGSASRRRVVSTVCVGTALAVGRVDGLRRQCVASRSVESAYIGADDRMTSSAQPFVDFIGTAARQQRASSLSRRLIMNYSSESDL